MSREDNRKDVEERASPSKGYAGRNIESRKGEEDEATDEEDQLEGCHTGVSWLVGGVDASFLYYLRRVK